MSTGHHAAVSAGVRKGDTVAVVGDGAVGLSAVLAAHRLGAERIIALSRHPQRQQLAREFGATDIVESRGDEATEAVLELTGGVGVDAALECVGTEQSIATAFAVARPGSTRRHRRRPARRGAVRDRRSSATSAGAAVRRRRGSTSRSCMTDVLAGTINPGRVFDYETDLDHVADAYPAMDERRAIKSLIRVGSV